MVIIINVIITIINQRSKPHTQTHTHTHSEVPNGQRTLSSSIWLRSNMSSSIILMATILLVGL